MYCGRVLPPTAASKLRLRYGDRSSIIEAMYRPAVGIIAVVLLASAVAVPLFVEDAEAWQAASVRVGLLMGAVWLAHPHLVKVHPRVLTAGFVGLAIVMIYAVKHPLAIAMLVVIALFFGYLKIRSQHPQRRPQQRPRKRPSSRRTR